MMGLNMLFEKFDLLMDSPNSISKIRELILQLAVQGKLVEQDPNDEPASELLKRIKAEKENLLAEGKIKKTKLLPPIAENEIPYELPQGWTWVHLGEIGLTQTGSTPPTSKREYYGNKYAFIKPADISGQGIRYNNGEGLSKKGIEKGRLIKAYSVLMVCIGGSIGKVNLVDRDCSCNQQINAITPSNDVDFRIVNYNLASPYFQNQVLTNAPSTTLPILSKGKWDNIPFPLSPVAEQKRIVAKVDQLMQLCDQLDARQRKASTKYKSLNDAALEKLLSSKTIDEFAEHWQFLCNNFDLIFNDPAHVNKLRQAVLQLAVQGKLAPQDPNDEPASELLKRIEAEKEKLISEGKNKKQKPLPPITEDGIPYELPQGWEWARLGDICNQITDGTHHTPHYVNQGVPFLSVKDISKGKIDFSNTRFVTKEEHEKLIKRCKPEFENILFTKVGTTGIAKVVDVNVEFSIFVSVAVLKFSKDKLYPYFLEYLLNSPLARKQSAENTQGIGNKNLVIRDIARFLIPIPPLIEQKRIVSKVDQLMHHCDELETQLNQSKNDSEMLMQAVLHEVFS